MKGLFIPGITAEMLRNGCLEAIEALMVEGEIYDIDYDFKEREPCEDTISRQAALDAVFNNAESPNKAYKAIRILPSAQPEPCDDAVSRFKVLRLIENSSNDLMDSVDNRHLQNEVKKLPPVTPAMPLAKISFDKDNLDEMAKEAAQKIKEQLTATKAAPATPPVYAVSADDVIENMESELELCNRVLDDMDIVGHTRELYSFVAKVLKEQIDFVKELPQVEPESRMGKWLINSDGYYPYCSECKTEPKSGEMTDFCPKCGAKMEG